MEYEGEFQYDRKCYGKGYDESGNVIYELIYGNGKGKEYDDWDGNLKYEGEYLNAERNGIGKDYETWNGKNI